MTVYAVLREGTLMGVYSQLDPVYRAARVLEAADRFRRHDPNDESFVGKWQFLPFEVEGDGIDLFVALSDGRPIAVTSKKQSPDDLPVRLNAPLAPAQ